MSGGVLFRVLIDVIAEENIPIVYAPSVVAYDHASSYHDTIDNPFGRTGMKATSEAATTPYVELAPVIEPEPAQEQ